MLLACAAGVIRGYLRACGDEVDGLTIRATVPVNLRPLEHAKKLRPKGTEVVKRPEVDAP